MVMAPRMIQSMEILQLPLLALQERIEQEMLSNPILEMEEPSAGEREEAQTETEDSIPEVPDSERSLQIKEDNDKSEEFQRLEEISDEYGDYWSRAEKFQRSDRSYGEIDKKMDAMQNTAAPAQSLNEYLHEQWAFVECEPAIRKIGSLIIDFIDETGYLPVDFPQVAQNSKDPIDPESFEQALRLVQTLEPFGVGARTLAECLLIQLRNSPEDRTFEIQLIKHHLKDIEMNRFPAVAKKTGRSITQVQHAMEVISRLDPKPGLQIGRHDAQYVLPDIIVDYDEINDTYTARLTDGSTPNLHINHSYLKMFQKGQMNKQAREFVQNSVRSARWLIEAVEQRKATLLRVVNHVLQNQRDFFDNGPLYLKPLPMVEVAQSLGIHVGTVSRAVSGKYMQTPIGIFPLRYFFSSGTENAEGQSVSWDAVKAKLQQIIDGEDKQNPFSDDDLVVELARQGLTLARRTVAKYRTLMNIPTARRRKQYQ